MGCVEKSKDGSAVRPDFLVNDPAFLVVSIAFVVRSVVRFLVERVT
jgi:hypothetical protein